MTQTFLKNREGLVDDLSKGVGCRRPPHLRTLYGNKRAALPGIGSLEMRRAIA